jgi:hypothetical protein
LASAGTVAVLVTICVVVPKLALRQSVVTINVTGEPTPPFPSLWSVTVHELELEG